MAGYTGDTCEENIINADALHDAVLKAIARTVNYDTVMHKIIAESEGWNGVDIQIKELRVLLGKNKQFVGVRIENLMKGIKTGIGLQLRYDRVAAVTALVKVTMKRSIYSKLE